MKTKPLPIPHMALWGALSGAVLAILATVLMGLEYSSFIADFGGFIIGMISLALSGAVVGYLFGVLNGILLSRFINYRDPFTAFDMQRKRWRVYISSALFTSLFLAPIGWAINSLDGLSLLETLYAVIGLLAIPSAMVYAAHRYMFRLRIWNEHHEDGRKAKPKYKKKKNDTVSAPYSLEDFEALASDEEKETSNYRNT